MDKPRATKISAIVLAPDLGVEADAREARELIVRSLVWLVSAVVSGVVREVILATPTRLDLADVADQSGCDLAGGEREADRLKAAVAVSRGERLLVIRSGFQPDPGLVDELAAFLGRARPAESALLLAAPETAWQRLFPDRAPAIGIVLARDLAIRADSFERMATAARHAMRLRSRASRIG